MDISIRPLVEQIRDRLYATPDTVCLDRARLITTAYWRWGGEPPPLKRARAFAYLLKHMSLDLDSNPVFAGNTSARPRAWMLVPEHGFALPAQILIEHEGLEALLDGQIPADLVEYWADRSFGGESGVGHLAVDLDRVVHEGLEALIVELDTYPDDADPARGVYREAMRIALQAVIDWAARYEAAASAAAQETSDPLLRALHERVARACRQVPAHPARDLFEGLQAIALVHLAITLEGHGMSVSIGLPDRVLARFVDPDAAERHTELIAAWMLKITANSIFGRGSKTQAITVAGADHHGRDRCNQLTMCFLDAWDMVRVGDPHLFVRWHPDIDPQIMRRAAQMLAGGLSMPLLINDAATAGGFVQMGVAPQDAWEYCVIGCNELGIPGRLAESATATSGTIQYLALLNEVLFEHPTPDEIADMSRLMALLEERMSTRALEMRTRGRRQRARAAQEMPTPLTSALMHGCVARGQDMLVGMDYHLPGLYERGLTNAANALAAIEKLVFEDRALSMGELVAALRSDLPDEHQRRQLLAAPKWGNDDPRADAWASALVEMRERVLEIVDDLFGDPGHTVCHVVRSLHHLDGRRIAASADGRHAWTPVADSIGATAGTVQGGPTAVLGSVLKLDAARYYRGGYNLNLTLGVDATPYIIHALIETFFEHGGQEIQINVFDTESLREAQRHSEAYGNLIVRVAGFSARFVDLSLVEQEELIARAESVAVPDGLVI